MGRSISTVMSTLTGVEIELVISIVTFFIDLFLSPMILQVNPLNPNW